MLLTDNNFTLYAARAYSNANCLDTTEFCSDLKRIKYLKKLFGQYKRTGNINERLIMNHIVVLYNVFSARPMTKMLLFKLDEHWDCLKPFLLALGYLPSIITGIKDDKYVIDTEAIVMDSLVAERVKGILRGE